MNFRKKEKELSVERDEGRRKKDEDEKMKAAEIRKTAMETHGQTKKRKHNDGDESEVISPSQKRRTGTETLRFLREKNESNKKEHEDKMELKRQELALRKSELDNMSNTIGTLIQTVQTQMQSNQQQMQVHQQQIAQQMQVQQQQALQQTQIFAALIEKLTK